MAFLLNKLVKMILFFINQLFASPVFLFKGSLSLRHIGGRYWMCQSGVYGYYPLKKHLGSSLPYSKQKPLISVCYFIKKQYIELGFIFEGIIRSHKHRTIKH